VFGNRLFCSLYAWPPATINQRRYIDGGCYSIANLDLADGFDKVLVPQPDLPPFPYLETLDEQRKRLQREGAQVEVITPDEAMKAALASVGGNALDPSLRGIAANLGREQGRRVAARVADLWQRIALYAHPSLIRSRCCALVFHR
jgi:NTE family protein